MLSGHGDVPFTAEEFAEWRNAIQSFISDSLDELRLLTEGLDMAASDGGRTQDEAKPARLEINETAGLPPVRVAVGVREPAVPPVATGPDNAQQRLADLARQLDERLQRFKKQEDR
jgi:hypothetical protein